MSEDWMIRQGDVLIERIDQIPAGLKPRPTDGGPVVLAYGEVTGHAHVVTGPAELYDADRNIAYLRAGDGAQVVHEEHTAHVLPAGDYRVTIQREYTPDLVRNVAD